MRIGHVSFFLVLIFGVYWGVGCMWVAGVREREREVGAGSEASHT